MSIQMIGEQVLVAAAPKETTTSGGIILSSEVKATASEPGIILSVCNCNRPCLYNDFFYGYAYINRRIR